MPFPYRIVAEWSAPDDAFVARVPALPGCSADGPTMAKAISEAQVAAEGILAAMEAHGRPAPPIDTSASGASGNIRLRLPRSLHANLSTQAELEGVSLNQLMVSMLSAAAAAGTVLPPQRATATSRMRPEAIPGGHAESASRAHRSTTKHMAKRKAVAAR